MLSRGQVRRHSRQTPQAYVGREAGRVRHPRATVAGVAACVAGLGGVGGADRADPDAQLERSDLCIQADKTADRAQVAAEGAPLKDQADGDGHQHQTGEQQAQVSRAASARPG